MLGFALCELLSAAVHNRTMAATAYANVRAAIADGGSDARGEVNQRALIDKVREKGWIKYLKMHGFPLSISLCVIPMLYCNIIIIRF